MALGRLSAWKRSGLHANCKWNSIAQEPDQGTLREYSWLGRSSLSTAPSLWRHEKPRSKYEANAKQRWQQISRGVSNLEANTCVLTEQFYTIPFATVVRHFSQNIWLSNNDLTEENINTTRKQVLYFNTSNITLLCDCFICNSSFETEIYF